MVEPGSSQGREASGGGSAITTWASLDCVTGEFYYGGVSQEFSDACRSDDDEDEEEGGYDDSIGLN